MSSKPRLFEKASSTKLYSCAWSSAHEFVLGGENRALKKLDLRQLSSGKSDKCVVWKVPVAHEGTVRDIACSPLVPYWIATVGDDGCARVWDTRYGQHAARVLKAHSNVVTKVSSSSSFPLLPLFPFQKNMGFFCC